jgi:hypothetical protein
VKQGKNDRKQNKLAPLDTVKKSELPREVCIWIIYFCDEEGDPARGGEAGTFQKLALRMPTLLSTHTRQRGRLCFFVVFAFDSEQSYTSFLAQLTQK